MNKLVKLFYGILLSCLYITANAAISTGNNLQFHPISFHLTALYLQPDMDNLNYAVFVSGNQPYQQSWHDQTINPGYSPAFQLGINYAFDPLAYDTSLDWLHVGTSDSSAKQASQSTDIATVQFVAPPYDVGPAVFGIKHASSTVTSNFNNIELNIGKLFTYGSHITVRVFGGVDVLSVNQNLTTTFNDYAGSPEIPGQAYALPADPNFYFTTKNTSSYTGVGPDLGLSIQYLTDSGFGAIAQFAGALTVGTIQAQDNFTSSSTKLIGLGMSPSQQAITTPNATQLVPGFDSNVGVVYNQVWKNLALTIEGGYHFAYYNNAISTISPDTLVQAPLDPAVPEFATGTMAINSTTTSTSPYSLSGPYLNLTLNLG